jgi:hypothetical protein
MAERDPDPEPSPLSDPEETAEPDWAREIRDRRKARADRLREVFEAFDGTFPTNPQEPT